jgi:cytochrome c biogenesis protein CcdA
MKFFKQVPASVWIMLGFAIVIIAAGLVAMAILAPNHEVSSDAIAALIGAVLGLVGAHVGHTTAHAQAKEHMEAQARIAQEEAQARIAQEEAGARSPQESGEVKPP